MSSVRIEHKYLISYSQYLAIKINLQSCFGRQQDLKNCYPISSLYFDTPEQKYYYQKINGEHRHLKIRLRKYSKNFFKNSDQSIWLETKIKTGDRITKVREKLNSNCIDPYSVENWPLSNRPKILEERSIHRIFPFCLVYYNREAFENYFNRKKLRVTFDHDIACLPFSNRREQPRHIFHPFAGKKIIMEIKYENEHYPLFLKRIVQQFSLQRIYFSKYAESINFLIKNLNGC